MKAWFPVVLWCTLAVFTTLASTYATAAEPLAAENKVVRCALIDLEQTPLGGLLEAELLARPGVEWLERTEINKVFAERNLQTLFSADSGDQRASLGKTLKADVLVILREVEEDQKKYAELVVAESNQGLRLVSQRLLLGADLLADSESLLKLADQGIAKAKQPISHVFAVPPLINQDLVYEFDYLRATYAKLLEQSLLDAPGVVVVELAEAKALAEEHNLAGSDAALRRRLPIYLIGEYQTRGQGDERQVLIDLKAQQGAKELVRQSRSVSEADAPGFLKQFAEQLAATQGIATSTVFPRQEAAQLNARAKDFERLANWEEALALSEASLLLLPDQPEIHGRAIDMLEKLEPNFDEDRLSDWGEVHKLRQRALQHLRILVSNYPIHHAAQQVRILQAPYNNPYRSTPRNTALPSDLLAFEEAYQKEKHALTMQLVHRLAEAQQWWPQSANLLRQAVAVRRVDQRYADLASVIFQYQDVAGNTDIAKLYAHGRERVERLQTAEGQQFLKMLRDSPQANAKVRESAERMLALTNPTPPVAQAADAQEDSSSESRLTFRRIELTYRTEEGKQEVLSNIWKTVPLPGGMDAFIGAKGIYLFRPERSLEPIYTHRPNDSVSSLEYDGRFLWLAITNPRDVPLVRVIDLESGEQFPITKADGLPLLGPDEIPYSSSDWPSVRVACLGPGRALVSGYIGRTWLAEVTFRPGQRPLINIFHEAKDTLSSADPSELVRSNLQLRFRPHDTRTLTRLADGEAVERAVVIYRFSKSQELSKYPLLVNGSDLSIHVLDQGWGNANSHVSQGAIFFDQRSPSTAPVRTLYRRGLGDERPVKVLDKLPDGHLLFDDASQTVDCAGWEWQRWDLKTEKMTSYGHVPWLYLNSKASYGPSAPAVIERGMRKLQSAMKSSHFGTLVVCNRHNESTYELYQVLFDGSGQSWEQVTGEPEKKLARSKTYQRPPLSKNANLWTACGPRTCLAWSPDAAMIVTGGRSRNETLQAWDAESGRLIANLLPGWEEVESVAFSPSGDYFASGGRSGTVILWDAQRLEPIHELETPAETVLNLEFSWNSDLLVACFQDGNAKAYSTPSGSVVSNFKGGVWVFGWLGFSPDDQQVLGSTGQNPLRATEVQTGAPAKVIESMEQVAGYRADRALVGIGNDWLNTLVAWDMKEQTSQVIWPRFPGRPLAISDDGNYIAAYQYGDIVGNERAEVHRVDVWHIPTRTKIASHAPIHYPVARFSPSGKSLAIAGDKPIRVDLSSFNPAHAAATPEPNKDEAGEQSPP